MLIERGYAMFWSKHLFNWQPGSGSVPRQMLGSLGTNAAGYQVVDFRKARGMYVLSDDFVASYMGLAMGVGGLGARLKRHLSDGHADKWDRFCRFSFSSVAKKRSSGGPTPMVRREKSVPGKDTEVIGELEGASHLDHEHPQHEQDEVPQRPRVEAGAVRRHSRCARRGGRHHQGLTRRDFTTS